MGDITNWSQQGLDLIMQYVPTVVTALITLVIGLWIIKIIVKAVNRNMGKSKVDVSLQKFLASMIGIGLKIMLLITVIGMFGVQMTSFIAIIGAAGLAVGLALQGTLANFAGGVLILLFKPYKVGDVIEAQGFIGGVHEIQIFNTILKTPDKKTIIIPNGGLSNGSITNYTTEPQRRIDFTFGIGYEDNIDKAQETLLKIIAEDDRILKDPAPMVKVSELADSSVNFATRVWCNTADYWDIYFDMHGKVKKAFDANGISIPFPQTDVHLYKHEG
ncbi:mechanosensitive ion channel protein MscS [candidate division LCP-89 bacterium B3_LCP]|uniref:Mechanosensitive ion channel protein MscS n=1 Tax=candidate division LCP-89 bacterium B3_LCP TaxID=2012998 RepID=A0A532V097_UNCL8|nr:MAG: mechanosensitive ion channel protein MscS [candidate division LCP-89 bacterium B3_LCP]